MFKTSRGRRSKAVALAGLTSALVATAAFPLLAGAETASPSVTSTATPTSGLVDGQVINIHVDAVPPGNPTSSQIFGVEARVCKPGAVIDFSADFNPTQTGLPDGFVPLPPTLAAEAAAAIPAIGSAPLPCTPPAVAPPANADPSLTGDPAGLDGGTVLDFPLDGSGLSSTGDLGTGEVDSGADGSGSYDTGSFDGSAAGDGGTAPGSSADGGGEEALALNASQAVPAFAGTRTGGVMPALLALVVIVGATAAAAFVSSRLARTRTPRSGSAGGS